MTHATRNTEERPTIVTTACGDMPLRAPPHQFHDRLIDGTYGYLASDLLALLSAFAAFFAVRAMTGLQMRAARVMFDGPLHSQCAVICGALTGTSLSNCQSWVLRGS